MPYIEWTPDMGEISGFGGSYEEACRLMVKLGIEYWEEQDRLFEAGSRMEKFDPHYQGYKGVFGIISDTNSDARDLDKAMMDHEFLREGGITGAMHQAAVSHIMAFRKMGAEEYMRTLREREKEPAE